ncbi:unnamed protein product [Prorocentrum cordatum]|uniref:Uncharacterized protein n=1 Tax=Prorocentrum cordatum TaxID=2364126 RepID=A0ABN9XUB4_9DINO|nr:unnamed protein product [Polarella glacialis]
MCMTKAATALLVVRGAEAEVDAEASVRILAEAVGALVAKAAAEAWHARPGATTALNAARPVTATLVATRPGHPRREEQFIFGSPWSRRVPVQAISDTDWMH